jgi:diguanylate cyclase (GGDEF)-like protein
VDLPQREELERQLACASYTVFSPGVASLYEQSQERARKWHLQTALWLTAAAVVMASLIDYLNKAPHFAAHMIGRAAVILLCAAGIAALRLVRPGASELAAFGVPIAGQAALSAWILAAEAPDAIDRNVVVYLILFAVLCAVPPLPAVASRRLAAIWFACFVTVFWIDLGTQQTLHHLIALAIGAIALGVGTFLAAVRETARRRAFLGSLHTEQTAAELRRVNADLERMVNTDALTGVANRRNFESEMSAAWQQLAGTAGRRNSLGLILVDVDHFKAFNDCCGHAEGDACLRSVAQAIGSVVRGGRASVARWGGEEFAVLGPGLPRRQLHAVAERIRGAVEGRAIPHPAFADRNVTVSIGAAWCGPDVACDGPDALLRAADRALYAAKRGGRNRVVVAMDEQALAAE